MRIVSVFLIVVGLICVIYEVESDVWYNILRLSIRYCVGFEFMGKFVYIVGGSKEWKRMNICECYDLDFNEWNFIVLMNVFRSNIGLVVLNGFFYVVGGYDGKLFIR